MSHKLLFDKSVQVKQLDVIEQHGILLFRAGDKGKESNVHVYRLSELNPEGSNGSPDLQEEANNADDDVISSRIEEEDNGSIDGQSTTTISSATTGNTATLNRGASSVGVRTRSHTKLRRLDKTRGCHLYSITRPGGSHLRMVMIFSVFQRKIRFATKFSSLYFCLPQKLLG